MEMTNEYFDGISVPLETQNELLDTNVEQIDTVPQKLEEWEKPTQNIALLADDYIENKTAEKRAELIQKDEELSEKTEQIARKSLENSIETQQLNNEVREVDNDEQRLENEVRQLRIDCRRAEILKQHKYNMESIDDREKHRIMLDRRKMLLEKYKHLYEPMQAPPIEKVAELGADGYAKLKADLEKQYIPKKFSYNKFVNKLKAFVNSIASLPTSIKITFVGGLIVGGIYLIKSLGIL